MTQQELELARVLERATTDADFRQRLRRDPDAALAGYDLDPEARAALLSADASQVRSLGVDARVTKGWDLKLAKGA